jgi:hypothetical protein
MSLFARPRIAMQEREDGCLLLRSADPLQDYPGTIVHSLWAWAVAAPDYPLVAQRGADGSWRACSYGAAVAAAAAIGQALLEQGVARGRPLLVLSGNSIDHLLVTLGGMIAGVPVAPVSVAYSLQSRDHARIRAITELIDPGAVSPRMRTASGRPWTHWARCPRSSAPAAAQAPPGWPSSLPVRLASWSRALSRRWRPARSRRSFSRPARPARRKEC